MQRVTFGLVLLLVFLIPCESVFVIAGLVSSAAAMGLLAAAAWIVTVLLNPRLRPPAPFHIMLVIFILWNAVSIFWSLESEVTLRRVMTLVQLFGMVWILWDLTRSIARLRSLLQAYVLGACAAIADLTVHYAQGDSIDQRFTGAGLNANDLALILALGLPVAWHLATSADGGNRNHLIRIINLAYIPAALFAIALTASRMGLFAITPAVLYILGTSFRFKPLARCAILIGVGIGLSVLYQYVPESSIERLATTKVSIMTGDLGGRVQLWREGFTAFTEHPLTGVGGGAFQEVVPGVHGVAHNTFLSVLVELGTVGFVLFTAVLAMAGYAALSQPPRHTALWLAVLSTWTIGAFALTWEHSKPTWLFLALVIIGSSLNRRPNLYASALPLQTTKPQGLPVISSGSFLSALPRHSPDSRLQQRRFQRLAAQLLR